MDYDDVLSRMPRPMPRRDMPRPMPERNMPDMPRRGGGDKIDLSKLIDRLRGRSAPKMPPRFGPDNPAPRDPIQMMLPGRVIGNPGSPIGIRLPPRPPEGRPRPEPNVPNAPPRGGEGRIPDMPTRPSPKSKIIEDMLQMLKGGSGQRTRPSESKRSPKEMMDMLREKLGGGIPRPRGQSYEDVVARGEGGINPVIGPNGERLIDLMESGELGLGLDRPSMPRMPGKVMRMNEGGEAMSPLEILYGQIGVADESGARDVIEKILSGQSSELTEDQRALTNSGIYRRVANRLGILDRAGNPISAGSSVATDAGRTYTPTIGRALQTLSEMEGAESGSGIESLLKQILGYNPNQEATGGAYRQAIEASGFPGFMAGVGGEEGGQPTSEQPNKGYAGYGGQGTSYGGNYGNPEYKGYFGEAPAMPYAGMSSPNPSLSNIIGMAPVNYFGMADVVGKDEEAGGNEMPQDEVGMADPSPGAGGRITN